MDFSHVFKVGNGNNQWTKANPRKEKGPAVVALRPVFTKGKKLTITDTAEALLKQGFTLEHAGMENFSPSYKLTGKDGKSVTLGAKELASLLTKKSDPSFAHSLRMEGL